MSIIREKILYNNSDMNLKINLGSTDGFTGLQQEIDKITQFTTAELVNPVTDGEMRRFEYHSSTPVTLQFQFYEAGTWGTSFIKAGFTLSELTSKNQSILNSFFAGNSS
jgi:hypothetical protein